MNCTESVLVKRGPRFGVRFNLESRKQKTNIRASIIQQWQYLEDLSQDPKQIVIEQLKKQANAYQILIHFYSQKVCVYCTVRKMCV